MPKKKVPEIDITYASGWIRGQMVAEDATTGEREIVPGLLLRIRADAIVEYHCEDPNVIIIITSHDPRGMAFFGKIETLDKIMARHALKEVVSNDD